MDDHHRQLQVLEKQLQEQLQASDRHLQEKDRQLQQNQQQQQHAIASRNHALERKERELQQTQKQLRGSEQFEFQESLQRKDRTITDLQMTISEHERNIQQMEQGDTASRDTPQQEPVPTPQTAAAATCQKDISKMRWREGKSAPKAMIRGAAVVHENTAYFNPTFSQKVYSYQSILGKEEWSQLPDNPNCLIGLAVIDGLLTSVGSRGPTNTLFSLTGEDERKQWSQIFPPMPTSRAHVACIATEQAVVVAGGVGAGGNFLDTVEVMDTDSKVWSKIKAISDHTV